MTRVIHLATVAFAALIVLTVVSALVDTLTIGA